MSSTGTLLTETIQTATDRGIKNVGWHFAHRDGSLYLLGALFRTATGTTPPAFYTAPARALLLIETNEHVMDALRWISAALPTDAPSDPDTGKDDHLEHVDNWLNMRDFFTGREPNTADVTRVLRHAAQLADVLDAPPVSRAAA